MGHTLTLTVNGKEERLSGVSPTLTLLEYLRRSGRVGTKEGCAEGDCGACTVAVVGAGPDGRPHYLATNSCLVPLASVAGRQVVTVEGVAPDAAHLHPVQEAMVNAGGSQCGYCTPGFVMSMFAALYGGEKGDGALEGNLCRCTGYLPIRRAAASLPEPAPDDPFILHLETLTPKPQPPYEHGGGRFFTPTSLEEVFTLLHTHPDAKLVAGATDLGVEINKFGRTYPVLVSLEGVPELRRFEETTAGLEAGAGVTLSHLEARAKGIFPALDEMLRWFAARQIRNRATLGGNLGTASPIGDLPPVLMALDAEVGLARAEGARWVPVADFFTGYRKTVLEPGEVIVSVRVPKRLPDGAARRFSQAYKVGKRGTDDISIVAAAFTVDLDGTGRVVQARLAYGGVAPVPVRAPRVEQFLVGRRWDARAVLEAGIMLREAFSPIDDLRGSAAYRKVLAGNLFEKFFHEFQEVST